jgi:hypothetical protein
MYHDPIGNIKLAKQQSEEESYATPAYDDDRKRLASS